MAAFVKIIRDRINAYLRLLLSLDICRKRVVRCRFALPRFNLPARHFVTALAYRRLCQLRRKEQHSVIYIAASRVT